MILAENKYGIQLLEYLNITENEILNFHPVSGAFVVVSVNGKFLLGYNILRNQWEFPAGKIEKNESARVAAVRELFEETHQKATVTGFKGLFKIYDKNKDEIRFRAVFFGETDRLTEFRKNDEDEMSRIALWDGYEDIGYIDSVDLKIFKLAMNFV